MMYLGWNKININSFRCSARNLSNVSLENNDNNKQAKTQINKKQSNNQTVSPPPLPKKERKKERMKERKKERKKERNEGRKEGRKKEKSLRKNKQTNKKLKSNDTKLTNQKGQHSTGPKVAQAG